MVQGGRGVQRRVEDRGTEVQGGQAEEVKVSCVLRKRGSLRRRDGVGK